MLQVLNLLSDNARGFILTVVTGTGAVATEAVGNVIKSPSIEILQITALVLTCVVAGMTIISYLYKFYKWARNISKKIT